MANTKEKPKDSGLGVFKNTTKANIYTTKGRCGASDIIELSVVEGKETKGLEIV